MATDRYDLVILGSGSTAFAAAIRAAELGKRAVMTEARTLGGTCVNRGCLPSKNLIEAARLLYDARNPRYPGIEPCEPNFDFGQLVEQKDEVISGYRDRKYDSIANASQDIDILRGRASFLDSHTVSVEGQALEGEQFLVALGSSPYIPPIEGLDCVPYLTSDLLTSQEDLELRELPESLIIIGGGYIALELGQMFSRFGTDVTLIERGAHVLSHGYDPEVGLSIQGILTTEGVVIRNNTQVQRVRQEGDGIVVTVSTPSGQQELRAGKLLVATGRRPNILDIGLEKAGVEADERGAVRVDEYLRTTAEHMWAAGDVIGSQTGSQMATPVGAHDGAIAAHNALSGEPLRKVDHRVIPRSIFTDPQIGLVGMTEEEAIARGHSCWCNTLPVELVPRAGAIRDTRGIIKMVADADTQEVLGVSMVGASAAEVIHEAAMGLRFRAKLEDFIDLLHMYPTMAEALKLVAISRYKDPGKLSCCAE